MINDVPSTHSNHFNGHLPPGYLGYLVVVASTSSVVFSTSEIQFLIINIKTTKSYTMFIKWKTQQKMHHK